MKQWTERFETVFQLLLYSCTFIFLHYLLACCYFSFSTATLLSFLVMVFQWTTVYLYGRAVSKLLGGWILPAVFVFLCIAIVCLLVLFLGYLPVGTAPQKVNW